MEILAWLVGVSWDELTILRESNDGITIPRKGGAAMYTKNDWQFKTVPQPLLNNRVIDIPAGKVVGGSSGLNGLMFDRGAKGDYDAWEELGNPGWGWKGLLPYFKKVSKYFKNHGMILTFDIVRNLHSSTSRNHGRV